MDTNLVEQRLNNLQKLIDTFKEEYEERLIAALILPGIKSSFLRLIEEENENIIYVKSIKDDDFINLDKLFSEYVDSSIIIIEKHYIELLKHAEVIMYEYEEYNNNYVIKKLIQQTKENF